MTSFVSAAKGPFTPTPPAPTLASLVGFMPATINMFPWSGCDGKMLYGNFTDFTNSTSPNGWVTTNSSVTNSFTAMDGTATGQKLVENSGGGNHSLAQNSIVGNLITLAFTPIPYRLMVVAAAAQRTRIVVQIQSLTDSTNMIASVGFDLAGGNTGYDTVNGSTLNLLGQSMIDLGTQGGIHWWACLMDVAINTAVTGVASSGNLQWLPTIFLDNGSGTAARSISYTGNGTSGAYLWLASFLLKGLWGRTQSFFDDFQNCSTVDLNKTKAPGFNWYYDNVFPNSAPPTFFTNPQGHMQLLPSGQSVVKIVDTVPEVKICAMLSVTYTSGSGAPSVIGNGFKAPMVLDLSQTFGLNANQTAPGPAWTNVVSSYQRETLDGTYNAVDNYMEMEWMETVYSHWIPFKGLPSVHSGGCITSSPIAVPSSIGQTFQGNPVYDFYRLTSCWLSAGVSGSGVADFGVFMTFINGSVGNPQNSHGSGYQLSTGNGYGTAANVVLGTMTLAEFIAALPVCEAQFNTIWIGSFCSTVLAGELAPGFVDWIGVYQ